MMASLDASNGSVNIVEMLLSLEACFPSVESEYSNMLEIVHRRCTLCIGGGHCASAVHNSI
jgi:hypothetical protein